MADDTEGVVFKTNKRRKVARQRRGSVDDINDNTNANSSSRLEEDTTSSQLQNLSVRHPILRKKGVLFVNTVQPQSEDVRSKSVAIIPQQEEPSITGQHDRFVSSTGRLVVQEDVHMSAFIDAKLAEFRSIQNIQDSKKEEEQLEQRDSDNTTLSKEKQKGTGSSLTQPERFDIQPIPRRRVRPKHTKREPRKPTTEDLARNHIVDQVLHEGSIPIYNVRTETQQPPTQDADQDNDAAAATAFKAEFLASLEERNRHRKSTTTTAAPTNGPKLGGSRMAREKMKAIEEQAKTNGK